jgi:hypothetical protein
MALGLTAAVAVTASAGQTTPGSGMLFIADMEGSVEGNVAFDVNYPYPDMKTRAADAVLGLSYGVVNWDAGVCTAGEQARLAKWDSAADDYERLGTWGRGGYGTEIGRGGRGLVRYDDDTYVLLNGQYMSENANASRPPTLLQIEYYDGWFTTAPYTDDQYLDSMNADSIYLMRVGPRPAAGVQWGPRPPADLPPFDPNDPNSHGVVDWTWVGAATTGKLQFGDAYAIGTSYAWNNDPNNNPTYDYIVYSNWANYKVVDDNPRPGYVGGLYKDSRAVSGQANDYFAGSSALDLVAFYGESENVLYLTQYAGRIYKMAGVKNLGWRRRAGQAAPGTRLGDGTNITQAPGYFYPVYVGGSTYANNASGGGPVIGDAVMTDPGDPGTPTDPNDPNYLDPNDPNWMPPIPPTYEGTAITSVELFNADPNFSLDPVVTDRHYTGLAVDCGGRVYAVSERVVNSNGDEPGVKYQGTLADVWNGAPGDYGLNRIETQRTVGSATDPNNPVRGALFGDPWTTTVAVGDTLVLTSTDSGTSLAPAFLNVEFEIKAIDPNGYMAKLDADCGDSAANFDVNYTVFPPGVNPIPDPNTNQFTSQALIDVYQADGTLDISIDLNALARPDGKLLGDYLYGGGNIKGVIIHGDVEVDPGLVYVSDPNAPGYDPNWPMDPLGADVTRLWIYCAGGDGSPGTDDGLDLVVVDVNIATDGSVAGASFVGGTDDGDIDIGQFQAGPVYDVGGFVPWNKWISFSELEFDGAGNMVAVGGRAENDNRYAGMTAANVREAVARMVGEAAGDPNDPNNDGIVGVNGFNMDMNLYGFKTSFGMAFDNTPLSNPGSCYPLPIDQAVLIDTEPDPNGSLPKTQNNLILCVFDRPITLPAGNPLVIQDMSNGCADVSNLFTYTIDLDDPNGQTLQATENLIQLTDMHWYQVKSAPGWTTVVPFQFEVYTLIGDCTPSARVTTADYSCVKAALGQRGDVRPDLNGSGRVTTADYSVVKANLGHRGPAKPALCP